MLSLLPGLYRQAQRELQQKLMEHADRFAEQDAEMRKRLREGKITEEAYTRWQRLKVWQGGQWKDKLDSVTRILADANAEALKIVNGQRVGVFAQNATYQSFLADQAGIGGVWNIYDEATVARLLKEKPELLPGKTLNRAKDQRTERGPHRGHAGTGENGHPRAEKVDFHARQPHP